MILIIANQYDKGAHFLAQNIQNKSSNNICLLTENDLLFQCKVTMDVNNIRGCFTILHPQYGEINSNQITLLINRLTYLPQGKGQDASYIHQEWLAIYNGMLHLLNDAVINPPDLYSFLGHSWGSEDLSIEIRNQGFNLSPEPSFHQLSSNDDKLHYLLGALNDTALEPYGKSLDQLSRALNMQNFEISYQIEDNQIKVTGLTFLPDIESQLEFYITQISKIAMKSKNLAA